MAYTIKHTDTSKTPKIVEGATVDNSTSVNLIGKHYTNYGIAQNENLLHLLENFASGIEPAQPLEGQLYFDSTKKELKYFDGIDTQGNWKPIGSMTVDATVPVGGGEKSGHLWLNSSTGRLSLYYVDKWIPILTQIGNTFYINRTRYDTTDTLHETLEMIVNSELVTIISSAASQWIPNSTTNPEYLEDGTTLLNTQFPVINAGVNMNNSTGYLFSGTATSALYADLAERYAADDAIEYGTVVVLGGTKEITKSTTDKSPDVFGVISTNPAFMMNSGAGDNTSHPYVALTGRVPCRVIGKVKKGDRLVSSTFPGHARAVVDGEVYSYEHVIGRALEANIVVDTGLIEIVIGAR